jgi:transposase
MAPLPEKLAKVDSVKDALARYTEAAKAHNAVLAEHQAALVRIASLEKRMEWFRRQMFGTRSEKLHPMAPEQQALLELLKAAEEKSPVAAVDAARPEAPSPRRTVAYKGEGHGWGEIPAHLPRVDVETPLTTEQKDLLEKGVLVKIRDEVTERLALSPQRLYVKRFLRPVFARVDADGSRTVLPLPPLESPIEKGRADLSILAFLVVSKFVDHLPLDRIRKIFLRQGIHLATSTMATWLKDLHELLRPVYLAMASDLAGGSLVHADETTCRVVVEGKKHKTHQGYLWVYIGRGHRLYEYTPTRGSDHPCRLLKTFRGTLQADGYQGYNAVCTANALVRAGCHAHARRKFVEALPKHPKIKELLDMYAELFRIEAECTERKMDAAERLGIRTLRSGPLLEKMRAWIDEMAKTVLPQDPLGEAVTYILGQWEPLCVFLKDGSVPLDNNISERALRPVVLGRNNYLFFGSEEGAVRGALFYSLVQSCVALGINPLEYLEDVMARIDSHADRRIVELTPAGWLAARNPIPAP